MASQDALYEEAAGEYGAALERLAGSYEADRDKRRDLLQDIHLAIWRSFEGFAGNCSLRTWVYRVAHNVAASHVIRHQRAGKRPLVSLDEVDDLPAIDSGDTFDQQQSLERLREFIQQLKPIERQVILHSIDAGGTLEHLRNELARQRNFHWGSRFWQRMLIFVPGPLVFFAGFARAHPEVIRMIRFEAISFVVLAIAAIPLNLWMARRYERQIDELTSLEEEQ